MTRKRYIVLDTLEENYVKRKESKLRYKLRWNITIVWAIEALLLGMSVYVGIRWWETEITWTVFFRAIAFIRFLALTCTYFRRVNPLDLMGTENWNKILRYLSFYPELGTWMFLGYVDYLFRYGVLPLDFLLLILNGRLFTTQALFTLLLDFAYILELYVGVGLIYYRGVMHNIVITLAPKDPDTISIKAVEEEDEESEEEETERKRRRDRSVSRGRRK